jgi:hypothetical protein
VSLGGVLAEISKDYFIWIFVPRSGPLDTEDEGNVNLRNAGNYSPNVTTSHSIAVRTSNAAMFIAVLFQFLYLSSFHEIWGARWLRPTAEVRDISCKKIDREMAREFRP